MDDIMNEELEAFRKALLQQAYEDFLSWAWGKKELHKQYAAAGFPVSFEAWVTEAYWNGGGKK